MDMICGCIWDTLGCPSIMSPMASQSDGDTTNNILDRVDLTEEQTLGLFTTYVYIYIYTAISRSIYGMYWNRFHGQAEDILG